MSGAGLLDLFVHFASLSLLAIGGALAVSPEMNRYLVDERSAPPSVWHAAAFRAAPWHLWGAVAELADARADPHAHAVAGPRDEQVAHARRAPRAPTGPSPTGPARTPPTPRPPTPLRWIRRRLPRIRRCRRGWPRRPRKSVQMTNR
jgi:hypothetical protein